MANPTSIPTQRRTMASAMDETCARLDSCPAIPAEAKANPLSLGGYIVVVGEAEGQQERWRLNADMSVREYCKFKAPSDMQRGKCPWAEAWWVE